MKTSIVKIVQTTTVCGCCMFCNFDDNTQISYCVKLDKSVLPANMHPNCPLDDVIKWQPFGPEWPEEGQKIISCDNMGNILLWYNWIDKYKENLRWQDCLWLPIPPRP